MQKLLLFFLSCLALPSFSQNFNEREVEFWDLSKTFKLSGTLTTPKDLKKFPVAVLISGSGQTDRDETFGKHKLFKSLAEYLSNNGIGVLRYDDRGGYKSGGPKTSQSTTEELGLDAVAAVQYLQTELKFKKIGIIGHSEGGGLAPLVASKIKNPAFVVAMAGPAHSGKKILIRQNIDIYENMGVPKEHVEHFISSFFEPMLSEVVRETDSTYKAQTIKQIAEKYKEQYKGESFVLTASASNTPILMKQLNNKWFISFLQYEPISHWAKLKCRTLALNGSLDMQVAAISNLSAIEKLGNKHIKTQVLPQHNHLFQLAKTGGPQEYLQLKDGISDQTLIAIKEFIIGSKP
ncbi:MAG TPA: alpha/beta fold hydrolase [Leadbetterella sp.]|nr:alpha/beta fold hydrolase [Leadbetterella sp.]